MINHNVTVVALTDRGRHREHNQDAILVGDWISQSERGSPTLLRRTPGTSLVCAVADGMGGQAAGALASRNLLTDLRETLPPDADQATIAEIIVAAGARLGQLGANPELRGLGTTIAGVLITDTEITAFNVGDSRIYLAGDDFVYLLSEDDTTRIDNEPTGILTQSLGDGPPPVPHVHPVDLEFRRIVLCSDGISAVVPRNTLRPALLLPDPFQTIERLAELAIEHAAPDNYSVVVIDRWPFEVAADDPQPLEAADTPAHLRAWGSVDDPTVAVDPSTVPIPVIDPPRPGVGYHQTLQTSIDLSSPADAHADPRSGTDPTTHST